MLLREGWKPSTKKKKTYGEKGHEARRRNPQKCAKKNERYKWKIREKATYHTWYPYTTGRKRWESNKCGNTYQVYNNSRTRVIFRLAHLRCWDILYHTNELQRITSLPSGATGNERENWTTEDGKQSVLWMRNEWNGDDARGKRNVATSCDKLQKKRGGWYVIFVHKHTYYNRCVSYVIRTWYARKFEEVLRCGWESTVKYHTRRHFHLHHPTLSFWGGAI